MCVVVLCFTALPAGGVALGVMLSTGFSIARSPVTARALGSVAGGAAKGGGAGGGGDQRFHVIDEGAHAGRTARGCLLPAA
jgi:hypothetical protein